MKKLIPTIIAFLAAGAGTATAQISIETDGTDAANLTKITVDGTEYTSFIGVDLTGFNMTSRGQTFQVQVDGVAAATGTDASALMEDSSLTTAYAAMNSLSFDFQSSVVNRAGADLFIFETNLTEGGNTLNVTINGTQVNIGSSGNPFTSIGASVNYDLYLSETAATSVAQLESIASWAFSKQNNGTAIGYAAIDLSDYGVADGASISNLSMTGSGDYDISGVVGLTQIPEPGTMALILGLAGFGIVTLRRRKLQ